MNDSGKDVFEVGLQVRSESAELEEMHWKVIPAGEERSFAKNADVYVGDLSFTLNGTVHSHEMEGVANWGEEFCMTILADGSIDQNWR